MDQTCSQSFDAISESHLENLPCQQFKRPYRGVEPDLGRSVFVSENHDGKAFREIALKQLDAIA